MSVIFETLKKLKTESSDKVNSQNKSVYKRRSYAFKKTFFSPSYVLLLLLSLTIIGTGSLYGYYHFHETTGENIKDIVVSHTDNQTLTDVDFDRKSEDKASKSQKSTEDSATSRIEYIASETNNNNGDVYRLKKPDDTEISFIKKKKISQKSKESIKRKAVDKTKSEKTDEPATTENMPVPEVEKIFLANSEKNAKIARLVADIHWEMKHGNKKQTEKYLDELALLKGQNNSYVLKLKAAWHIQNKEFDSAQHLLKRVLKNNELDQEAGINMAIIEINTKQIKNAYQRLSRLQTLYPENIRIAEIMQDLKLLFKNYRNYHLSIDNKS